MKSEHRHELKTNELAEWIVNFPQWAKKNLKSIIYIAVLAVAVAGLYIYKWHKKNVVLVQREIGFTKLVTQLSQDKIRTIQSQAQGLDTSYRFLQAADSLGVIGENEKNDRMAALAFIKQAEALRTELHYRLGTVTGQDVTERINRAKQIYTKAVEHSSAGPSLMAAAKFGLGLCEEELGNFEEAEQIYHGITTNSDFKGTVAVAQAKRRLETMAEYKQKIVFKASTKPLSSKPALPELIQPQIQLNPADIISTNP